MLPTGPFLLISPTDAPAARLRSLIADADATAEFHTCPCGSSTAVAGYIRPVARKQHPAVTRGDDGSLGIFDGFMFEASTLESAPHDCTVLPAAEVLSAANGMFLSLGAQGARARIITDPWATMPVYHGTSGDLFFASTSLRLAQRMLQDTEEFDDDGLAQLLCLGGVLDGGTRYHGVRKLNRARILDVDVAGGSQPAVRETKYQELVVAPDEYRGIEDDITDAFTAALRDIAARTRGRVLCTLSGGMDSRTIAAAASAQGLPFTYVTHASRTGNDVLIAREVAQALRLEHGELRFAEEQSLCHAHDFVSATNGMVPFTGYHTMELYPAYSERCEWMVDGVHSWIDMRQYLKTAAPTIRTRDDFFAAVLASLTQHPLLCFAHHPDALAARARDILRELTPDPKAYHSVGTCADTFLADVLRPRFDETDLTLLHTHYTGFASPYFDQRYMRLVVRLDERKRWKHVPQQHTIERHAPHIASLPRAYTQVRTLPVSNQYITRLPVAYERMLQAAARRPALGFLRSLSIARPSGTYRIRADRDLASVRIPPCLDEHKVRAALQPDAAGLLSPEGTAVLHLVMG